MDATTRLLCGDDLFNPVMSMGLQASMILSLSHLLQIAVKSVGIPTPIPQITAGLLIGHSLLSKLTFFDNYFYQASSADYYNVLAFFGRTCVVFLIGLELDISYMRRHLHAASIVASAAALPCILLTGAVSYTVFLYYTKPGTSYCTFLFIFLLSVVNTASPIVIRFVAELRLGTSDFGRLAVCSSLINDITSILCGGLVMKIVHGEGFKWGSWLWSLLFTAIICYVVRRIALLLNRLNPDHQYLKNAQIVPLFLLVLLSASFVDKWGAANSMLTALILGVTFPREGKTARTMMHKLSYTVYTFVLPIYFGYIGFQANFSKVYKLINFLGIVVVLLLGMGGKVLGTLAACHHLNIPMKEGVVLGLLLNFKGHFDVLILGSYRAILGWESSFLDVMFVSVVLNTLLSGIPVAFIVMKDNLTFGYRPVPLEQQSPETELRVLACVHGPRHVPTMVKVIGWLSWSKDLPICAYLMHLVELLPKKRTSKMYHQLEDDELSDDDAYGENDAVEINNGLDSFISETGIYIRQMKIVSSITTMFEDVCDVAEDLRASVVILPFHKHQRIDGKMESGKEGIRATNQRVLRHAPCSVAILIDRGLVGYSHAPGFNSTQHVAALFFGGPDDREALSLSTYMAMHLGTNLTVIRFLQASSRETQERINISSQGNEQVLMAMPSRGTEDEADNSYLEEFYNRYVTSGQVGYIEKQVKDGAQTAGALRDLVDMYQLFIVGNGGRRNTSITTGMSDWEECPELGNVGDLLASSEFDPNLSVLVIQQYRPPLD
ncbi:hypothetical protein RND81_11G238700 [Saponaria officinalis]|uniref:Cation/H+ exchanger domain-containing protein n=1 Tax=Saponaria officinalis TaxID=3572 RepID=A0AAW1HR20_SAPOF